MNTNDLITLPNIKMNELPNSGRKPKILILIDWFLPGYKAGGPIQSTSNLAWALGDHYDFAVITTDTDHTSKEPYPNIKSNCWQEHEGIPVYYFSRGELTFKNLQQLIAQTPFDYLYLNSMYSLPFTIWPLYMQKRNRFGGGRVVLAPRGMLQAGAVAIKSLKKKPYLKLLKWSGVQRDITWHATDMQEMEDIAFHFGQGLDIRKASNIPKQQQLPWKEVEKLPGSLKCIFSSRVSKKKNLEFFLQRLHHVKGKVVVDVFGPKEDDAYWQLVQAEAASLPSNCIVNFKGAIPQPELQKTLRNYHLSVLTTHGENFGHSIFEGLLAGNPVLVSDLTPWRNLEDRKLGWDFPLDQEASFNQAIQHMIDMDQATYNIWSKASWKFAESYKSAPEILSQTQAVFSP